MLEWDLSWAGDTCVPYFLFFYLQSPELCKVSGPGPYSNFIGQPPSRGITF